MEAQEIIDDAAFNALVELGGKELVSQMVDLFMGYVPRVIKESRDGMTAGNIEPVMRMGHSLHSSGRNLGVIRMKELGFRIEMASREKRVAELPFLVNEMERVFEQAKPCLEEKKARL